MGKPLNALLRYRIRQRFLPPEHICPNGTRPTTRLPGQALQILRAWLLDHRTDPYPSKLDKDLLTKNSGLSPSQVKTWFANARRRLRLKKESNAHKSKGGHPSSCSEIEADLSCSDGLSDSPEDLLSGEDSTHKEEGGESRYGGGDFQQVDGLPMELKQIDKTPTGDFFIRYAGKNQFYNSVVHQPYQPQSFTYDTISGQKVEKHEVARAIRSVAAASEKLISTQKVSTSYRPQYQHSTQTSEYLKAMAGMCEEISPSTYQLGMPRIPAPKHSIRQSVPDYHPQQQPRPTFYQVLQDETVRYLSYQQGPVTEQPPAYPTFRPAPCHDDAFPQKQKKWYQGHEIGRDQTVTRPYSMSAPPSLGVLTSLDTRHTYHQSSSVVPPVHQGHPQEPPWPTYQQSYTSNCFLGCNTVGPCTACKPATSRLTNDASTVPLPPFGLAMMGTTVATPAIHSEPNQAPLRRTPSHPSLSNQPVLQWTSMSSSPAMKYRATTLPAFAASFTVPASSVPLPSLSLNFIQQQQQGQGQKSTSPSAREHQRQHVPKRSIEPSTTSASVHPKKRQRHQSQPVRPGDRQFELNFPLTDNTLPRPTAPRQMATEQQPPCKAKLKRSCSTTEEELKNVNPQLMSDWSKMFSRPTSQDSIVNGQPAHVKTTIAAANQMMPPNAHTHLKRQENCSVDAKEALDSPSLAPSLSTPTPANSTESQEGMKEIAQVLLDLSTKGPQTSSSVANSSHNINR
ncbi:uncharacterized protein [Haliotis cracherodii]|uniref:uncharacterized protein n=1 Tax=Haliotis cracherodii TaxID=6455 RepID=UPI0039ED5720